MMNLSIKCPHCRAAIGELCKEDCSANGLKIKDLHKALKSVGLSTRNVNAFPIINDD